MCVRGAKHFKRSNDKRELKYFQIGSPKVNAFTPLLVVSREFLDNKMQEEILVFQTERSFLKVELV